mmetsp:Transcript_37629/g.70601  ORF Transcript_37629/g.70601 Transcript_37629/m.70601 type:complete len:201 (-) Transcript_37629:111-713(-)
MPPPPSPPPPPPSPSPPYPPQPSPPYHPASSFFTFVKVPVVSIRPSPPAHLAPPPPAFPSLIPETPLPPQQPEPPSLPSIPAPLGELWSQPASGSSGGGDGSSDGSQIVSSSATTNPPPLVNAAHDKAEDQGSRQDVLLTDEFSIAMACAAALACIFAGIWIHTVVHSRYRAETMARKLFHKDVKVVPIYISDVDESVDN